MPPNTITRTAVADSVVTRTIEGKDEDVEMLRVPISSTRSDREGDRFDKQALEAMADQIRRDQPMVFDNHGLAGDFMGAIPYDSRETIGAQMDAEVEEASDGEHDLYAYVNPDGTHPEGDRMLKQVRDEGQPLKFSVGFRVLNSQPIEDDAGNEIGRVFEDADHMETSRVGIPANPDASVTQSVAAKDATGGLPGYVNHPVYRMMEAMQGVQAESESSGSVAKNHTPDSGDDSEEEKADESTDEVDEVNAGFLLEEIRELRSEVESLKEDDEDDDDDEKECSVDTDCPEGEVCLEGECVPEDEVEDSTEPEETDSEIEALRAEIQELREGGLQRGESETKDTDMETKEVPEESSEGSDEGTTSTETKDEGAEPSPNDWLNHN